MQRIRDLVIGLVALSYPFLVYFGEGRVNGRLLGLLLLSLVGLRLASAPRHQAVKTLIKPALAFLPVVPLAAAASLTGDTRLLTAVPVAVSLAFFATFAGSRQAGRESMVERFARVHRGLDVLPPTAATYCRRLTLLWAGFFLVNALITAALALWGPLSWWALYSGLIAYMAMGLLMACEFAYRSWRIEPIARREEESMALEAAAHPPAGKAPSHSA